MVKFPPAIASSTLSHFSPDRLPFSDKVVWGRGLCRSGIDMATRKHQSERLSRPHAGSTAPRQMRIGVLCGIPIVLREFGVSCTAILRSLGLKTTLFKNPENRIPFAMAGQLLETCAQRTHCPHFGLSVGQKAGITSLGMVGSLMQCSPTVEAALRSFVTYASLNNRAGTPVLNVAGAEASYGYVIYDQRVTGRTQFYDGAMAVALNIMRSLCSPRWLPSVVCFAHSEPKDKRPYERILGTSLRFDAPLTALVFPERLLDRKAIGADHKRYRSLLQQAARLDTVQDKNLAEQLRRLLRVMLVSGRGSGDDAADFFMIHPRTLHRRLRSQGTTLRALVGEIRTEVARQLLEDTHMSVTDIAATLGYANLTAFTRAFQRCLKVPPSIWRQRNSWLD